MTVTIEMPLPAATNTTISVSAGGTLKPLTTYYYRIVALNRISGSTGLFSARNFGIPSIEVSATTTATDLTINLNWDAITNATGYEVYRTEVQGDYDQLTGDHRIDPESGYFNATTTTNSFSDDGTRVIRQALFLDDGVPVAIIHDSTEASPDGPSDIYDALIAAGLSGHTSVTKDKVADVRLDYYFRCRIEIGGWFLIYKGEHVLHEGQITFITPWTGGWTMGQKGGSYNYWSASYSRKWIYQAMVTTPECSLKWYNSSIKDLVVDLQSSAYVCANWYHTATCYAEIDNCIYIHPFMEFSGSCTGKITNSILRVSMLASAKMSCSNNIYTRMYYPIYAYYATENIYAKDLTYRGATYDIHFHKNTTSAIMDAINHTWLQDPPKGRSSSNPENFSVRRRYEAEYKIIDINGNPIENARYKITDATGNVINPELSTSTGDIYMTSGTVEIGLSEGIRDTSKNWETDAFVDYLLEIYEGPEAGQEFSIKSNTATEITIKGPWILPVAGPGLNKYRVKMLPTSHLYVGKAVTPFYDTTTYGPFTIEITASGYETYKAIIDINKKIDTSIVLKNKREI